MGKFHITKTIKKDFTEDEETERILSNLKRLHTITMYPHNTVTESMVAGKLNTQYCGIDKSGREKIFFESSYGSARYPQITTLGVEECRRRNYCVVQKAISELVPGGKQRFKFLMPIEEFYLYTFNGNVYWLDNNDYTFVPFNDDNEEWEDKNNITNNQIWVSFNSVEICQKILNIIKKQLILNKLAGKEEEDPIGSFLGAAGMNFR